MVAKTSSLPVGCRAKRVWTCSWKPGTGTRSDRSARCTSSVTASCELTSPRSPTGARTSSTSGSATAREIQQLLSGAAVAVVPSRWDEICPMIVLEALSHGCPVLATARGGLPYLVGDGGWVVDRRSRRLRGRIGIGCTRSAESRRRRPGRDTSTRLRRRRRLPSSSRLMKVPAR